MYRFTNHLANPSLVLVRKQIGDSSCAALIVMRGPQRQYSSQHGSDKPKSRKLLWSTVGATMLTGAAVVYAKENPEVRKWLRSNAPWADDFVALVYQENNSFPGKQLGELTASINDMIFGKEKPAPEIPSKLKMAIDKDTKNAAKKIEKSKNEERAAVAPPLEPLREEKKVEKPPVVTQQAAPTKSEKPQSSGGIKITKDLVELEHDMHENTKLALENYKKATRYCTDYTAALFKIVETSVEDLDKRHFAALQNAIKERDSAIKVAKDAAHKAKCAIDTIDRMIAAGVQAPEQSLAATGKYIKQFRHDIQTAESVYRECEDKAILSDRFWNKVEAARNAYREELQMLFPGVDLTARKLNVGGDTDLLLVYMQKQVQFLQNELAELQTLRDMKVSRAIESHDEKALIDAKVEEILKRERLAKEREYQLKTLEAQAEANRTLKEQLKKQFEIQQEVLQEKLKNKEKEVMGKYSRAVSEQLERERVQFKAELAAMSGKLQAIQQTLKERSLAEAAARRCVSLWSAAEALLAATRDAADVTPVAEQLKALEKAAKDDQLVATVVKGIPREVVESGIYTEKALKEKFDVLERTATKVALVGRDGASLPVYFLSWLQSKLLFLKFSEIPKDELDNQATDFSQLDTYDILQRARYHMDRGNLPACLRYVNLLSGAPRAAAEGWAAAARAHLEVAQAARAVMAHASVSGLLYL
ncbi:MICOS complex subunit Mic60 [Aricia agestis]|uniref:MICOS complex subunit Mic60 n=1 Tax=Aricia agestis TaxID=91739 RepID=UPI001C205348|nr:MICOS complex subunit Mic60 [Aricia agestis]